MKNFLQTWQEWVLLIIGALSATWALLKFVPKFLALARTLYVKLAYLTEISDTLSRMETAGADRHEAILDQLDNNFQTRRIHLDAEQEVAYFDTDARGKQEWANAAWHRMTGLTHDEARGAGWENALAEENRHRVLADMQQALDHQRSFLGTVTYVNRVGLRKAMSVSAVPVRSRKGVILGYRGVCTPV